MNATSAILMDTASEILAALRSAPAPMRPHEVPAWLFEYGFLPEELEIVSAGPATLRAIARELERLDAPMIPQREYPSLDAWRRVERKRAALPYQIDPLRTAAMYEAAARDADAEARYWASHLDQPGAVTCLRSCLKAADDAAGRAVDVLAEAEQEVRRAAA
jgi:hypothetical protein